MNKYMRDEIKKIISNLLLDITHLLSFFSHLLLNILTENIILYYFYK